MKKTYTKEEISDLFKDFLEDLEIEEEEEKVCYTKEDMIEAFEQGENHQCSPSTYLNKEQWIKERLQ